MSRFIAGIFFMTLFLSGCEKNIDFDLQDAEDLLVVDAGIENDKPPVVILTKSFNYFSNLSPELLTSSFVHDARVTISNGTLTHQLKEYAYPLGAGINGYFYSIDSSDLATSFLGQLNTNYILDVESEGKTYTANTTIPLLAKKPDSLWWEPAPFADDTNNIVLWVRSDDPPGLGNYIRYFTRKNSEPFYPGFNSVFDDQVIDGSTYSTQVDPGMDKNNIISFDSNYFKRGDTITLKLCNIDKPTYTFWSTWEFAFQSIGNPFAQPGKVVGNVSNGALGDFYGYAAYYKTLVVPK